MKDLAVVTIRELRRILTMKSFFGVFFISLLFYGLYYPQPYTGEVLRKAPMAVVDLDDTAMSREFARRLDASADAAVVARLPDPAAAERAIFERRIYGYVVVPKYFERELLHGRRSPIAFYGDGSYFLIFARVSAAANAAAGAIGADVVAGRLVAQGASPGQAASAAAPITLNSIPVFNTSGGYATYVVPASFLLILQQIILIGVGLLNTTPIGDGPRRIAGPLETVVGKLVAYAIVEMALFPFVVVVIPWAYGVPRIGDFAAAWALGGVYILACSCFGLFLARTLRNPLVVQLIVGAVGMPMFFLAGFAWPREMLPQFLQALSLFVPSTMGIDGIVRINQMGASLSDVAHDVGLLALLAAVYGGLAVFAEWRDDRREAAAPQSP